ncbi:phosphoribosylglycinamide formyltransferase [Thalassorhabdus alkalitolerans]|uniref:Phosphoribosylglycinamide formyltransferase n=1 Tax=Thalassorhabdus alkalitolerans TaxID=2282697 RepID=A0ABW0YP25_9BACI
MTRLAVFASGSGTNFQSIAEAIHTGKLDASIALVVCDKKDAIVLQRAQKLGIDTFVFQASDFPSKASYEKVILDELKSRDVEFLVLAGYMRLVGDTLLQEYPGKIVNIHPSLLPSFPGKDAIGQALQASVKVTGVTIHLVDDGMDTGPIIAQEAIVIEKDDNRETVTKAIQTVEHRLYPQTLKNILERQNVSEYH